MCDDSKYAPPKKAQSPGAKAGAGASHAGKRTGITDLKHCPQLDRTKWCERIPLGHDEDVCHMVSQKRRGILQMMKQLVDAHVDKPVCPEWDTSSTCENTPGPYRFGVVRPGANNDNYKIIASKLTASGCECIKRNGLQDECPLPKCQGSPSCKITPFPRCEPSRGVSDGPQGPRKVTDHPMYREVWGGDHCKCPDFSTAQTSPKGDYSY